MRHLNKFLIVLTICGGLIVSGVAYADKTQGSSALTGMENFDAQFEAMKHRAKTRNKTDKELSNEDKDIIKRAKNNVSGKDWGSKRKARAEEHRAKKKDRIKNARAEHRAKKKDRIENARAEHFVKKKDRIKNARAEHRAKKKDRIKNARAEHRMKRRLP